MDRRPLPATRRSYSVTVSPRAGWLTSTQAASLANLTPASFRKQAQRDGLPREHVGMVAWYQREVIEAWLVKRSEK